VRRLILIVAAATLLAGCTSDDGPERQPEDQRAAAEALPEPCELYLTDRGVFVRFAGEEARGACRRWAAGRPSEGRWARTADTASDQHFERVCVVYRGRTSAGLYATPTITTHGRAKEICGGLISRGWGELNRPSAPQGPEPHPSDLAAVRCSEGICTQGGKPVARPAEGSLCDGGAWSYAGLTRDQEAGLWRCLPDPDPREEVVCNPLTDTCTQDGDRVYPPRAGARCAQGGREWERTGAQGGTEDVYSCARRGGEA
jgi:hypothetical protein